MSARTDRQWLHRLQLAWRRLNQSLFRGAMSPVAMRITESARELGSWTPATRTISLSRQLLSIPWPSVIEVLKHEMAHQYAHEVLGATDEAAHGPAFRRTCHERGIDARAAGLPDATPSPVVARIRKLLALAESPEAHEAETAARKAQRMLLEHQLDLHDLDERPWRVRHVGRASTRFMAHEKLLAGLLARYFEVQCIWVPSVLDDGREGRMLEVVGRQEHVEIAEHLHAWLLETGERLWRSRKRAGQASTRGRGRFLAGFVAGFAEQCRAEEAQCAEAGLVRIPKPELEEFVHRRHRHLRSGRRTSVQADGSFAAGKQAGRRARFRPPLRGHGGRRLTGPTKMS